MTTQVSDLHDGFEASFWRDQFQQELGTTSPHLKSKLKEVTQEAEKALELVRRLPKLPLKAQQALEPELYVVLAVLREKITSALREWERVVDEELIDD